jgi:hypothetical protein
MAVGLVVAVSVNVGVAEIPWMPELTERIEMMVILGMRMVRWMQVANAMGA